MLYPKFRIAARRTAALALFLPALVAQAQTPAAMDAMDVMDANEQDYPVVITPTRLKQALADVPASVTILTAETLRLHGVTSVVDALRLVPGMAVMRSTSHDYKINYHGTNTSQPRRMNVLVDGISVYKPGLSRVDWPSLPVSIEDIDRIEVIRGSNSAAYGPNSMMAIINILTRHPKDVDRGLVSLSMDSRDESRMTLRMAGALGSWHVRATYERQGGTGYDVSTRGGADNDGITTERLNLRSHMDLAGGSSLEAHGSLGRAHRQLGRLDPFRTSSQDIHDTDVLVGARLTTLLSPDHEVQVALSANDTRVRQRWDTCWPQLALLPEVYNLSQANPDYIRQMLQGQIPPTGGTARDDELAQIAIQAILALGPNMFAPVCGRTDNDLEESRVQLELQDTYVVSERLRLVSGLGARHQHMRSQTYLAGRATNTLVWMFGHAEFRPSSTVTTNIGGYFESNSLSGDTFSPRLAMNWHLPHQQTLRLVYSEGTRTPDLFEEKARWSQTIYGIDPPLNGSSSVKIAMGLNSAGNTATERIQSTELGYLMQAPRIGLTLDVKLFDDRMSQLLVDHAPMNVSMTGYIPPGSVRLTGLETQMNWDLGSGWSGFMHYTNLLNRQASNDDERRQWSRHSGAVGISRVWPQGWQTSLSHHASSGNGTYETRSSRTTAHLSRALKLGGHAVSAALTLSYLDPAQVTDQVRAFGPFSSGYDSKFSFGGRLSASF